MNRIEYFRKTVLMSIIICLFSVVLVAQQVVTGRITDDEDGFPVPGASVYIANTTIGTTSSGEGYYSLTVPGRGSFEIVVSHVGFQSVVYKIDTPQDTHQYDVVLGTNELEEITIKAPKNYRRRDVDLFWRMILGEKPSKSGMEVLNPEKVHFYLTDDKVLKVMCREPIEIINHQTGYRIQYTLQRFEHDYRPFETKFEGTTFFEELTPANSFQKERWEMNRQEVYAVSVNHFLRALYREQIHEEGFVLAEKYPMDNRIVPVPSKDVVKVEQGAALLDIGKNRLLLCYAKPLTARMIRNIYFSDISKKNITHPVVVELFPSQIIVYPDGTYRGFLDIGEHNKYMGGLSSKVPVEYPETKQYMSYGHTALPSSHLLNVEKNMTAQLEAYPQEKIHLHTDRDLYIPGEKIWFKAYVVDAHSHLYPNFIQKEYEELDGDYTLSDNYSQYVYAELISPANTLVSRVMIAQTEGMFYGYLPLSDIVPEGDYTLRAYTRYMENMGDDYFFRKNIRIGNLSSVKNQQQQTVQSSRTTQEEQAGFDVSFFPEGGNLPEGVFSKVAFKAINKSGYPEIISGTLTDDTGAEITSVKTRHAGMGILDYLPEAGKRYFLKCRNENGLEKQFELPLSNPYTYALAASQDNNNLHIEVKRSVQAPVIPCYLLAHCRGTVLYFSEWDNEEEGIIFDQEEFPAGVIQFVLFNREMNPLSERMVFSNNDANTGVGFVTDKDVYLTRDKIVATLSLPDSLFYSVSGHFSIAVTDDHDIAVDETTTILSTLLLSSELKGYIENPAYYLRDDVAMDLLMMTHGWRRYNVPEVLKGNREYPEFPFQMFQGISGQVKSRIFNAPVSDSEILMMMKGGGAGVTSTDRNGFFDVSELEFPDSTTFYIRALDNRGRDNVKLTVDHESFPSLVYTPKSPTSIISLPAAETKDEPGIGVFMEKAEQRAKFDEDIWMLQLQEVAITALRKERKDNPRVQFWANKSSDVTITRSDIEKYQFSSKYIGEMIRMLSPGVVLIDEKIVSIRGGTLDTGEDGKRAAAPALLVIDGIVREDYGAWEISMNEVESVDVFKGASAAAFGMRGANGVVSITTRRGKDATIIEKSNYVVYNPLGYQMPVEYYTPKYETLEAKRSAIPDFRTTVFWKPNVVISEDGKVTFEFYTSDFRTTYSVVIEGITNNGRIVRQVKKIRVE